MGILVEAGGVPMRRSRLVPEILWVHLVCSWSETVHRCLETLVVSDKGGVLVGFQHKLSLQQAAGGALRLPRHGQPRTRRLHCFTGQDPWRQAQPAAGSRWAGAGAATAAGAAASCRLWAAGLVCLAAPPPTSLCVW